MVGFAALAACKTSADAPATRGSAAVATTSAPVIVPPPPPRASSAAIDAGSLAAPSASPSPGKLSKCHALSAVRGLADGPELDARGCPSKLKSDGEFFYTLNDAATTKAAKNKLCCYDEHPVAP